MNKKIVIVIVVVLLLLTCFLIILAKNRTTLAIKEKEPIKLGVIATLTGVGSYYGEQGMRGLELARQEINEQGGVNGRRIEFIVENSESAPSSSVSAIQKLIHVNNMKNTFYCVDCSDCSSHGAVGR